MNEAPSTKSGSPSRFGYSWDRFAEVSPEQEEQFRRWTSPIDPETGWHGKTFLDVGCGAGRNSYWAMKYGATGGSSIDVDERSLEKARRNLNKYPSVQVNFESIYESSIESAYDIVFSIGVIHHLEEPATAIRNMVKAVRPGGRVLIWVYGYENMEFYVQVLNPLRKGVFSWMPMPLLNLLSYLPAAALWISLRAGLQRIEYFRLLKAFPFRHLRHIILDQMLPQIANYWRREEVESLMEQAGLSDISLTHVNEMSWAAVGTKPI
jgi:SAM-dependent methyltransferase